MSTTTVSMPTYEEFMTLLQCYAYPDEEVEYTLVYYEGNYFGCDLTKAFKGNLWAAMLQFDQYLSEECTKSGSPIAFLRTQYEIIADTFSTERLEVYVDDMRRRYTELEEIAFLLDDDSLFLFLCLTVDNLFTNDTLWMERKSMNAPTIPTYDEFLDFLHSHSSLDENKVYTFTYYEGNYFGCDLSAKAFRGNVWKALLELNACLTKECTEAPLGVFFLISQYDMIDDGTFDVCSKKVNVDEMKRKYSVLRRVKCNENMFSFISLLLDNLNPSNNDTFWMEERRVI